MITAEQMDRLRLGIHNRCHPRVRDIEFEFRPLTIAEVNSVTTAALSRFEKMLPQEKHAIRESTLISILTLTKASETQPGVPGVTEATLMLLTADELGYLMREFNTMTELCNPVLERIPESELQKLADEVKKKAPSLPTELNSSQLVNLALYLATREPSPAAS